MSRRKKVPPTKLDCSTARVLSWNMYDNTEESDLANSIQGQITTNTFNEQSNSQCVKLNNVFTGDKLLNKLSFDQNEKKLGSQKKWGSSSSENSKLLKNCCIRVKLHFSHTKWNLVESVLLGKFYIYLRNFQVTPEQFDAKTEAWLFINDQSNCFLQLEASSHQAVYDVYLDWSIDLLQQFAKQQAFKLVISDSNWVISNDLNYLTEHLEISIIATKSAFVNISFGLEFFPSKKCHQLTQQLMKFLYKVDYTGKLFVYYFLSLL